MPYPKEGTEGLIAEDGSDLETETGDELIVSETTVKTGGILYRLHRAIGTIQQQVYNDALQIQNDMLPDNPLFTEQDAHDWYRRLGIYDSGSVSFADMKAAITQKMSWPVTPLNKQNAAYIQAQLQLAGFNVYVYENKFPGPLTPGEVMNNTHGRSISGYFQSGQNQSGQLDGYGAVSKIFNYLEPEKDIDAPLTLRSLFYISGNPITTVAEVPAARQTEFRQLVLNLKAAQMMAVCFIEFV